MVDDWAVLLLILRRKEGEPALDGSLFLHLFCDAHKRMQLLVQQLC